MNNGKGRKVISGIPKIGTDCHFFPAAMSACMKCLDGSPEYDYTYFDGMTGAAFGLIWQSITEIHSDLSDFEYEFSIPYAFEAAGYGCRVLSCPEGEDTRRFYKDHIVKSIDEGYPVIASGVLGPPVFGAVTGYDEGGEVLLGTNFFQNFMEHTADQEYPDYYRVGEWNLEVPRLVIFDGKRDKPDVRMLYLNALRRSIDISRTLSIKGHRGIHTGQAAYKAWAEDLLRDENFPRDDLSRLEQNLDVNGGALTALYGRDRTGDFLRRASSVLSEGAEHILEAADCHDRLWNEVTRRIYGPDVTEETAKIFARPEVRRSNAELLIQGMELDRRAAGCIERALSLII
ncbi:MAG: hypothetical protein AB9835_02850 [Eubacteriales bacterium]